MDRASPTRPQGQLEKSWWLWPNVLSLDAPAVAVCWQLLFARCLHWRLLPVTVGLLMAGSWCTYVLDRLLDARAPNALRQPGWRHAFYYRHQRTFWVLLILVGAGSLPFAVFALPAPLLKGGMVLSALLVLYLAAVHRLRKVWFPKEYAVGALFAAGVTLPFWSRMASAVPAELAAFGLFGLACQINTVAVEFWESGDTRLWMGPRIGNAALVLSFLAEAAWILFVGKGFQEVFLSVAASAICMAIIARRRRHIGSGSAALMDAALLMPILFLIYHRR